MTIREVLLNAQINFKNANNSMMPNLSVVNPFFVIAKNQLDNAIDLIMKHDKGLDDEFDEDLLTQEGRQS